MSGPSAIEKPISAKIAASSSITWLIGWMRPGSSRRCAHRQGDVERLGGEPRFERRFLEHARGARRAPRSTASFSALMAAPCALRSSGAILPSVASRAEIEPFLPSARDAHGFERGLVGGRGDRASVSDSRARDRTSALLLAKFCALFRPDRSSGAMIVRNHYGACSRRKVCNFSGTCSSAARPRNRSRTAGVSLITQPAPAAPPSPSRRST